MKSYTKPTLQENKVVMLEGVYAASGCPSGFSMYMFGACNGCSYNTETANCKIFGQYPMGNNTSGDDGDGGKGPGKGPGKGSKW